MKKTIIILTKTSLFVYIAMMVLLFSNYSCIKGKIHLEGFDQEAWKKDSIGCLHLRERMKLGEIEDIEDELMGRKKEEIIDYFGKPNRGDNSGSVYILEPTPMCYDKTLTPYSVDIRGLRISYNSNGRVESVDCFRE